MSELPTGTVTFLFTDIEGSTRLLERLGDAYAGVLAEHNRVLREAFERHGGVEIAAQGDSFVVAFATASDAVAAAADAQRGLVATQVRVRMGIHTGEPELTDDGYVGLDVHRAARIGAAGHGGQVVVSETTRALLDGDFELRDLGEHRLKDLGAPIRLYQVGSDEFPRLRSLNHARLPLELVPLLGRKRELGELLRLLGSERLRLVTLTGPGGMGKTSLAVAAASELVESFDEGVTLVELAAIRDPSLVLPTIAEALGAESDAEAHISNRELLLVLDNLEQVVSAAGDLARLLAGCPNLSILATSREPLRITGEREFALKPLAESPAVELFRQRAEAVLPGFSADYERLAEISRRLDSLPLAIELAAARVKVLPPGELLRRLERRLPVLTGARRDLPERQQTLRATIEWSYDLCSVEEQQLFGRLAVFLGGFTLDMAETVCDADLDTLASLLDKNLIRREGERFSMLETIREYAVERLEDSGAADEVRRRLAVYMTELAESTEGDYLGPEQASVQRRFRAEWDNVRAVLDWALDAGEVEVGLRLIGSLTMLWLDRNVAVEGEQWLQTFLERAESVDVGVRAKALMTGAMVAGVRSEYTLAAARTEEALGHFRSVGSREGVAWSLTGLAVAAIEFGRPQDAGPLLEEAEDLSRQVGNDAGLRRVLHLRGQQAQAVGDVERGRELLREAAERSKSVGDMFSAATSVHSLGDLELEAHRLDVAEEEYKEGLALSQQAGADRLVCYCIAGLAAVVAERGDADRAATLWGFAEAYEAQLKFRMRGRSVYERRLTPLAGENADRYERGRTFDLAAAAALALS